VEFSIEKGDHMSWPRKLKMWPSRVEGTCYFTQESQYELGDEDQLDWNKLTGISRDILNPDRNAAMIGWRYDPVTHLFDVAPYYNYNGAKMMALPTEILRVSPFQQVHFLIETTGRILLEVGKFQAGVPYAKVEKRVSMRLAGLSSFRVQPWFGGNEAAPSRIKLHLTWA
jgi:hypothetical protein